MIQALLLVLAILVQDKPTVKVVAVRPEKAEAKVGEVVKITFDLEIPAGWHVYPANKPLFGKPLVFSFENGEGAGEIVEPPTKDHKDEFLEYTYHEGKITIVVPIRLKPGVAPGPFDVKGLLTYQICDPNLCVDNKTPFSFPFTVLPGVVQPVDMEYEKRGLVGLILLGMLGGLVSLVMPCTYPIIPITLTYFVKQAAGSRSHGVLLSSIYSLGIILSFTGLGFLMTILLGAGGARIFAANPWVNVVVAVLFLGFMGSLFGWYEIRLPFGLGSKLAGGPRTGAGGAFILGLLFAVVTFTCTIPIAATILSIAAGQHRGAALVAMVFYSLTMALPFFLMGFFPALIKEVPKSGGWLHTVKVTMAFIELGLALYYLSKADQTWEVGILNRQVMLAAWVALFAVVAAYLLGFFRARPNAARVAFAILFLALGGRMAIGFTGKPLGILGILVPPDARGTTLPEALREAREKRKPLFAEFTGVTCTNCLANRETLLPAPEVERLLKEYVVADLWTDRQNRKDRENNQVLNEKYGAALPLYVIFTPDGEEIDRIGGRPSVERFVEFLKKGLSPRAGR